jgi:hypothetical protein
MSNFRAIDRETGFLLPPSIDDWLPEQHLARFVVEVIDGLDLSAMVRSYRGSGSAPSKSKNAVIASGTIRAGPENLNSAISGVSA